MQLTNTLGFLGFGNMGGAIAQGLVKAKTISPQRIFAYDPVAERVEAARQLGANAADSPAELAKASDVLVLAVKPQMMDEALTQLQPGIARDALVISIAAGVPSDFIRERLGTEVHIVRAMPNTPALVATGAAAIALSHNCSQSDADVAQTIFEAVGITVVVPEEAMDTVTALSGSGPAYFFYMVECLIKGAVAEGLEEEPATRLAVQTLLGAGRLLAESGLDAAELRERVTSKGGTTAAALARFREHHFEETVVAAVHAATERGRELSP